MERRPLFKPVHPVYEVTEQMLRLGEAPGYTFELEDENGSIRKMIKLMDGTRTIGEIHTLLVVDYPEITYEEIVEAVESLSGLGFLMDQAKEEASVLTSEQKERYKANIRYFSLFTDLNQSPSKLQEQVSRKKVTILGMGAFGSTLLVNLVGAGIQHIKLVDFDRVELSNLNRQMVFNEHDIGRLKVEAARDFIGRLHSEVLIETETMQIKSSEDVERVIAGSDLVMLAADQPFFFLQRWVNHACTKLQIPFIAGGFNLIEGQFFMVEPGKTGCIDCMHLHRSTQIEDYPQLIQRLLDTNFILPTATIAPNTMMITGMMASDAIRYLTGIAPVQSAGKFIIFDFNTLEKSVFFEWERNEAECPTCGRGSGTEPIFHIKRNEVLAK
ncbi:thiamin biosynthesis protein [Brevibacillus brevis]|uniref:HesA/MoeB/ThiF family protein n=1 Tax=Brevibacillus brevis TaxID=1393 RepID=UPI000B39D5C1|nr:MoeB/ThiF family adenylyltransferase [Brevibacillus brevis]OUQ90055.1 thiamin biosynthesis protein [Brevibacillus brevis]